MRHGPAGRAWRVPGTLSRRSRCSRRGRPATSIPRSPPTIASGGWLGQPPSPASAAVSRSCSRTAADTTAGRRGRDHGSPSARRPSSTNGMEQPTVASPHGWGRACSVPSPGFRPRHRRRGCDPRHRHRLPLRRGARGSRRHDGAFGGGSGRVRGPGRPPRGTEHPHTRRGARAGRARARGAAGQCDRPLPLVEREAGVRHRAAAGDARRWHHRRAGHRWRLEQRHVRPVRRDQARGVDPSRRPARSAATSAAGSSGWRRPTALERCDRHAAASSPADLPTSCSSMRRSSGSLRRPTRSICSSSRRRRRRTPCPRRW